MDPIFAALQVDLKRTRGRLPAGLDFLADVVWNFAWSWLPGGTSLFRDIDPELWEACDHNALAMLERTPVQRLAELHADPEFLHRAKAL